MSPLCDVKVVNIKIANLVDSRGKKCFNEVFLYNHRLETYIMISWVIKVDTKYALNP